MDGIQKRNAAVSAIMPPFGFEHKRFLCLTGIKENKIGEIIEIRMRQKTRLQAVVGTADICIGKTAVDNIAKNISPRMILLHNTADDIRRHAKRRHLHLCLRLPIILA